MRQAPSLPASSSFLIISSPRHERRSRNSAPRLAGGGNGVSLASIGQSLAFIGVDLEEVVEDDHEHGSAAKEDGERVEGGVGDHGGRLLARPGVLGTDGSCGLWIYEIRLIVRS